MAIAMSKPTANVIEPSPALFQSAARSALANRFQVNHKHAASNSQMPHLRRIWRTKVSGPLIASKVASAPNNRVQSSGLASRRPSPNARLPSRLAASRMTMISNAPQPTNCSRLRMAGRLAPYWPRLSFSAAMAARPVSQPITPAPGPAPAGRRSAAPSGRYRGRTTGKTDRARRTRACRAERRDRENRCQEYSRASSQEKQECKRTCGEQARRDAARHRGLTPFRGAGRVRLSGTTGCLRA